jgi:hypothetical protein
VLPLFEVNTLATRLQRLHILSAELLEIPSRLAESLAGKDAAFIQMSLERAMQKCLQALSRPEIY